MTEPPVIEHNPPMYPLTSSQRIHRFFHRLGAVLCGLCMLAALGFGISFVSNWAAGPRIATQFSDIYFYGLDRPVLNGSWIQYKNGSAEPFVQVLQRQNDDFADSHRRSLQEIGFLGGAFAVGGLILYALLRAIGWIVAGATRT